MFKLVQLSIRSFVVVKVNDETDILPINVHAFIQVVARNFPELEYEAVLLTELSKELAESGEIESLKKEALEQAEEAVADEFFDC